MHSKHSIMSNKYHESHAITALLALYKGMWTPHPTTNPDPHPHPKSASNGEC